MTQPNVIEGIKLGVGQVFLEAAEFRHRGDPLEEPPERKPSNKAELALDMRVSKDGTSVAVRLRVATDDPDAHYFYSVTYVVVLTVEGANLNQASEDLQDRLLVTGATMAMPFVREMVGNLSGRGRFGATWVNPVNFTEVIKSNKAAKQQEAARVAP